MIQELASHYSTIKPSELMAKVIPEYCIDSPLECLFWERGANDTYQVRCADAQYYLRVYRCGAFPREAVEFEAETLAYLHQQGFPVGFPIVRNSGGYITEIAATEGPRFVLLTAAVKGNIPDYQSLDNCRLVGESVAQFHAASTGFKTSYKRSQLDLTGLLDVPMDVIREYLAQHTSALDKIETIGQQVKAAVQAVPEGSLDFGICHGDMHGGNLHLHDGIVTHFDFEECAFGYRLYDVATFKWDLGSDEDAEKKWSAFIDGYMSVRPIAEPAYSLIDTFIVIRELSEAAYGIRHIQDFGHNDILASDIDRLCNRLQKMHALNR